MTTQNPTTGRPEAQPPELEALLLAAEEVDNSWYDDEGTVRWHPELWDRLVDLRRANNAFEEVEIAALNASESPPTASAHGTDLLADGTCRICGVYAKGIVPHTDDSVTDDSVAMAVMTSMDNPEECHARVGEGWACNQPKGHKGPHGVVYVGDASESIQPPESHDDE